MTDRTERVLEAIKQASSEEWEDKVFARMADAAIKAMDEPLCICGHPRDVHLADGGKHCHSCFSYQLSRCPRYRESQSQPDPYEELIERLDKVMVRQYNDSYGVVDMWRYVAKAVLAELRTSCELGVVNEFGGGTVQVFVDRDLYSYPAKGTPVYLLPPEPTDHG